MPPASVEVVKPLTVCRCQNLGGIDDGYARRHNGDIRSTTKGWAMQGHDAKSQRLQCQSAGAAGTVGDDAGVLHGMYPKPDLGIT